MKTLAQEHWKNEIVRRIRILRPDSARVWGQMSANQMICHLNDSFGIVTRGRQVSDATGLLQQTIVKWVALYLPVRWPHEVPTRPEVDQRRGGTPPTEFAADVAECLSRVELIASRGPDEPWPAHPFFGRMSRAAWLRWGYLHADHHLRQFGA